MPVSFENYCELGRSPLERDSSGWLFSHSLQRDPKETDRLDARSARWVVALSNVLAQQGDKWLTEARAAEIRTLVSDVLADSETRSSLQGSGATAGYDDGFFMASPDGNWKFKINVLDQVRFVYNQNNQPTPSASE